MHTKETKHDEKNPNTQEPCISYTARRIPASRQPPAVHSSIYLNECKAYFPLLREINLIIKIIKSRETQGRSNPGSDLQLWKILQSGWKRPSKNCIESFSLKASAFKHLGLCYWSRCCNRWGAGLGVFVPPIAGMAEPWVPQEEEGGRVCPRCGLPAKSHRASRRVRLCR